MESGIRILHVDDDPRFLEVTADLLAEQDERFDVVQATGPEEGLALLEDQSFDCVVSDYDMGDGTGIEFLEQVRAEHGDLPFILFTGKGSEEIASEAISAGVTDYLQKKGTIDQYALLANRVENAVSAREASRDSKRRMQEYETLIESAPVPMVVADGDGKIPYLNERAQETLGVSSATSVADTALMEFIHPDDRQSRQKSIERAVREREPTQTQEFRLVTTGDEERIVQGSVVPTTFREEPAAQLVFTDVTEQRNREAELKELNQFRETVIQNASVWISVLDDGGNVILWNRAAEEISGYEADDVMGNDTWQELLYPDEEERKQLFQKTAEVLREGSSVEGYESTITTADGERRHIRWDAHPLGSVSDEFDGALSVGWDVTDQHERTEQLKTLHEGTRELMEATDRETVAEFTAKAAKDILGYDYTAVRFVDEDEQVLRPVAVTEDVIEVLGDRPKYSLDGGSPHAEVYQSGELVRFDDVRDIEDDHDRDPVRSAMYLPLVEHGMVTICDPAVGVFDQSDIEIASVLVANAETALDRLDRQEEMARVRDRMQAFLTGTTDIISLIERDGTFRYHSPAVEEVLGYGQEQLIGKNTYDYIHPDDVERVRRRFIAGIEQGSSSRQSTEFRFRHADGSWVWVESQTRVKQQEDLDGYVVTSRDIGERKEQEQQLKSERERFSALFENFPEPTLSYRYEGDVPIIESLNAAFEETFGYTSAEAVGEPVDDLVVPAEKQEEAKQIDERVKDGQLLDKQVRRKTANGERTFTFRNIPYREGKEIDGFAVYNDINKRVERERKLRRQNERLDEFASIIAHDMRNPLNVAQVRAELLVDEMESEHLAPLLDAHERMETLLEETLMLARQGEMVSDPELVRISTVVTGCHEMVGTDSSTVTVEDDVQIRCDRDRLKQLFENLIKNAIEHGSEDVHVRVGVADEGCLYIADDGPGIPADNRDEVFEPGFTTGENGVGMGLAIVGRIVEAHDWTISVTESDAGGTRFEIDGVTIEDIP
jgi:PAS domain S-box-containing protein